MVLRSLTGGNEINRTGQPRYYVGWMYDNIAFELDDNNETAIYTFSSDQFNNLTAYTDVETAGHTITARLKGSFKTANDDGVTSLDDLPNSDFTNYVQETGITSTSNPTSNDFVPTNANLNNSPWRTYRITVQRTGGTGTTEGTLYIKGHLLQATR